MIKRTILSTSVSALLGVSTFAATLPDDNVLVNNTSYDITADKTVVTLANKSSITGVTLNVGNTTESVITFPDQWVNSMTINGDGVTENVTNITLNDAKINSTFTVNNTSVIVNHSSTTLQQGGINAASSLSATNGGFLKFSQNTEVKGITIGTSTNGKIQFKNLILTSNETTVSSGTAFASIVLQNALQIRNATLILNASNAFVMESGGSQKNVDLYIQGSGRNATLKVNANNSFKGLTFGATVSSAHTLNVNFSNNSYLLFEESYTKENVKLILTGFNDGALRFGESSNGVVSETTLTDDFFVANDDSQYDGIYKTLSSDYIQLSDNSDKLVYFVDATGDFKQYLGQVWTLTGANQLVASVPEPAEWAAIFGAIALGLAIYRRRK